MFSTYDITGVLFSCDSSCYFHYMGWMNMNAIPLGWHCLLRSFLNMFYYYSSCTFWQAVWTRHLIILPRGDISKINRTNYKHFSCRVTWVSHDPCLLLVLSVGQVTWPARWRSRDQRGGGHVMPCLSRSPWAWRVLIVILTILCWPKCEL